MSLGLGFLIPPSHITDFNLKARLSKGIVNKVIVNGLKKRLDDAKGKWVDS